MTDEPHTILLIEDDAATRTFLADNLTADGYEVVPAETARDGARLLESKYPDLALVDVGLPDGSGYDVLRRVREADGLASRVDPATPVVLLSGRATEIDRVRGFERGADDFVAKPFSYPELRGRVGALLRRRAAVSRGGRMRIGELEVDPAGRETRIRGDLVPLSQKEFALLRALAAEPTRVHTKEELLRTIWGYRVSGKRRRVPPYEGCIDASGSYASRDRRESRTVPRLAGCPGRHRQPHHPSQARPRVGDQPGLR